MGFQPHGATNSRQVKNSMGTCLVDGCEISINSGNNKQADIAPGTLRFLDNTTNPLKPSFVEKFFPGSTEDILTAAVTTHFSIKEDLTVEVEAFSGLDTAAQMRSQVEVGAVVHFGDNPIVRVLQFYSCVGLDLGLVLIDLARAVGRVRQSGLAITNASTNLTIKRLAGVEYSPFFENFPNSKLDPSTLTFAEVDPLPFFHGWSDGSGGTITSAIITAILPARYDDGTGGASQPNGSVGNNAAQIMRVGEVNGSTIIEYGQTTYNSISSAIDALATEQHDTSVFAVNTAFRGYLVVRGGATDLSDTADGMFFAPTSDFVLQRA